MNNNKNSRNTQKRKHETDKTKTVWQQEEEKGCKLSTGPKPLNPEKNIDN
jgi:hypothetical protein